jgi:Arc/MetJ-type ribon-helix-helix transcriptional regulator
MATKTKQTAAKTTRRGFGRESITKPNIPLPMQEKPISTHDISGSSVTTSFSLLESVTTSPITTPIPVVSPTYSHETSGNFFHIIQVRIDPHLFDSIHNAVESAIFGGDYSVESASHFIREALREHVAGKPLKVAHENGAKKSLSLRIDSSLKSFWETLPKRHRNNILERAIRTKLLSYLN